MFFDIALSKRFISLDKKLELQKRQLELNYDFVSIDAVFILSQLKIANYRPEGISIIITQLVRKETSIQPLGTVLADFLHLLMMDKAILSQTKVQIFKYILSEASQNHDLINIEESVFAHLQMKVKPDKHDELKEMIRFLFQGI